MWGGKKKDNPARREDERSKVCFSGQNSSSSGITTGLKQQWARQHEFTGIKLLLEMNWKGE